MVSKATKTSGSGKGTRKVKDKWRAKNAYKIIAPLIFNSAHIGNTLSDDPSKVIGRVITVSAQDLNGDISKAHIKLKFKITGQSGNDFHTVFYGLDLTSDYLRRLTRRKRSKIDLSVKATTSDNGVFKIKLLSISERRLQSTVKAALRNKLSTTVKEIISKKNFEETITYVMGSNVIKDLVSVCKNIYILKKLDIRRVEVVSLPAATAKNETNDAKGLDTSHAEENIVKEDDVEVEPKNNTEEI